MLIIAEERDMLERDKSLAWRDGGSTSDSGSPERKTSTVGPFRDRRVGGAMCKLPTTDLGVPLATLLRIGLDRTK